jgi:hypothetical protein
MLALGGRMVD